MNSQLYRISHNINIKVNDNAVESISKLLQSVLFDRKYKKMVEDSECQSYLKIWQEQNRRTESMYRMVQEQKRNEVQSLKEMEQLEMVNQDFQDEQQSEEKVNGLVGIDIANLIERIDKKQEEKGSSDTNGNNIKTTGTTVVKDEEEEYIKSNNMHLDR